MSASEPHDGIARTRHDHIAALNASDADAWVRCFTSAGVQMPPNDPANIGTGAIRAWSGGMFGGVDTEFALDVDEVEITGERWAFERGGYTIALTPHGGGAALRDHGKYITIYERQSDGSWLIARDIWNSDQQLPILPA